MDGSQAALEALARPETDIAEMLEEYRRRRNYIAGALVDIGLECHRPLGAFYAFPRIDVPEDWQLDRRRN